MTHMDSGVAIAVFHIDVAQHQHDWWQGASFPAEAGIHKAVCGIHYVSAIRSVLGSDP